MKILASLASMKTFWVVGFEIQEERANIVDVLAEQEKMETNGVYLLCPYYVRLKSEFYLHGFQPVSPDDINKITVFVMRICTTTS